ncbi:MAG: ParA family protein [Firmicutes bacterium]|nr:ParA family protein [Bacillota bacterium]
MKIIALANQKGGVGKSTTTINLGVGLAKCGKKVLLIDADSQGNLTTMLGIKQPDELSQTLASNLEKVILDKPVSASEGIIHCEEGVDLLPSNIELSATEVNLVNTMSRETVLKTYLGGIKCNYDYILIDCMPSLGMLTLNALTAADSVIIPVQSHYLSAKGLEHLLKTIKKVQRQLNPRLTIDGILLTMTQSRTNFSKEISELLKETYGRNIHIFNSEIPFSIKGAEMSACGKSIFSFEAKGKVAKAYENLTKEVVEIEAKRKKHNIDLLR